jgi:phosphatidylglycerol:prolipoprotein diacylglycerol transferase
MHRTLLSFPSVQSYGVMLALGWGLGWLAHQRARLFGVPAWGIDLLVPLLLVSCAVGTRLTGRLLHVLSTGPVVNDRVLYGGVLLALLVAIAYSRVTGIPLGRLGDTLALSLPLGVGLLRVGCFLAGCCWGDVCTAPGDLAVVDDRTWRRQVQTIPMLCEADFPLAVRFPAGSPAYYQHLSAGLLPPDADRSLPVHPVQLYEAAASWILLGMLVLVDRRRLQWGALFLLCGLGYAIIRFFVEWFRADNGLFPGALTINQYVSVGCACTCLILLGARRPLVAHGQGQLRRRSSAGDISLPIRHGDRELG